jgi:hypothetical protein
VSRATTVLAIGLLDATTASSQAQKTELILFGKSEEGTPLMIENRISGTIYP